MGNRVAGQEGVHAEIEGGYAPPIRTTVGCITGGSSRGGVTKAHRYDPDLNPTYYNFALHCGFGIVPAQPYKPRDKAKVENAVQIAQRWIVAPLRHRKFFSLEELNGATRELLNKLNHRPFRKREEAARWCSKR